jgi:hypothetical protein
MTLVGLLTVRPGQVRGIVVGDLVLSPVLAAPDRRRSP